MIIQPNPNSKPVWIWTTFNSMTGINSYKVYMSQITICNVFSPTCISVSPCLKTYLTLHLISPDQNR